MSDYFVKKATRTIWADIPAHARARIREQLRELLPEEQLALVTEVAMETYQEPDFLKDPAVPRKRPVRDYQAEQAKYLGETIN